MKRYLSIFFYSFCCVALWATAALASSPVMDAVNKYANIFIELKPLVYICGAFGIMAVACAAFFGKMDWLRLAFIGIALMFLSLAGAIVDYLIDDESLFDGGQSFASKLDGNNKDDPLTLRRNPDADGGDNSGSGTPPDPETVEKLEQAAKQAQYDISENIYRNAPPVQVESPHPYTPPTRETPQKNVENKPSFESAQGHSEQISQENMEAFRNQMEKIAPGSTTRPPTHVRRALESAGVSVGGTTYGGSAGGGSAGSAPSTPIVTEDETDKDSSTEDWIKKKQNEMADYAKNAEYKTNVPSLNAWMSMSPEQQAAYMKQYGQTAGATEGFAFDQTEPTEETVPESKEQPKAE